MPTFKLTWRPDNTQPLPVGQSQHADSLFSANLGLIQAAGANVPHPIKEANGVLDLRPFCPPIDNQLQISDCVADGTCTGLEFCKIRNGLHYDKLARLFLYYNARLQTQDTDKDEGTFIRLAFSTLTSLGTCPETTWPYDPNMVFTRPSWECYQQAYPNKVSNYYSIDPDVVAAGGNALVRSIKQALQAQHPVVFGMTVDQDYMNVGSDGMVAMPQADRDGPGGHCQVIVGYDNNAQRYIVQNSWGTDWGNYGYVYVPWQYLDASGASDLWVPTLDR